MRCPCYPCIVGGESQGRALIGARSWGDLHVDGAGITRNQVALVQVVLELANCAASVPDRAGAPEICNEDTAPTLVRVTVWAALWTPTVKPVKVRLVARVERPDHWAVEASEISSPCTKGASLPTFPRITK